MCACKQKKSFLIEDILRDTTKKKPYKPLSNEPSQPLYCRKETKVETEKEDRQDENLAQHENLMKFNVVSEVQHEMELSKVNLESRRNTYPLYPTAVNPNNHPWNYRKEPVGYLEPRQFSYYSDPFLNTSVLRRQLAVSRFVSHPPLSIRQAYGFDRGKPDAAFIIIILCLLYV